MRAESTSSQADGPPFRDVEGSFQALADTASDAIVVIDDDGTIQFVNHAAEAQFGYTATELVGQPLTVLMPERMRARHEQGLRRYVQTGERRLRWTSIALTGLRADGTEILLELSFGEFTQNGRRYFAGTARDVTEQRRANEELHASQHRYEALVDSVEGIVWQAEINPLRFTFVSRHAERLLGYSVEQWIAEAGFWETHLHPDDRAGAIDACARAQQQRQSHHLEYRMVARDGRAVWVHDVVQSIADGPVVKVQGIMVDVSAQKRLELERAALFEILGGAIGSADLDEIYRLAHRCIARVMTASNFLVALAEGADNALGVAYAVDEHGATSLQVAGDGLAAYVFRQRRPMLLRSTELRELVEQGTVDIAEPHPAAWIGVPLTAPSGILGVLTVQHYQSPNAFSEQDVEFLTAMAGQMALVIHRRRAEHALRVSEERYRDLVESATDIIYRHDLEYRFTALNKAAERITGYSREEALTMSLADVVAPDQLSTVMQRIRDELSRGDHAPFEADIITKDGRRLTVEANTRLIYEHSIPVGVQGVARDITERKLLETQLRQAQKMEAVGHLAGGIAHDFNNLLVVINGYSEMLLHATDAKTMRQDVVAIKSAGERAAALTRQLLAFSRKQVLHPTVVDLNDVISGVGSFVDRLIGDDVKVVLALAPDLEPIKADPGQLEQIIMNLAINARDAMPDGGTVVIETANSYLDGRYAQRHAAVVPGRYVMLAVTDNGIGMSDATREHIFEPFFTTKPEGKGTGLGLSTVYGIVKQSGGSIWVYSEPGRGTTFKVYLPTVTDTVAEPAAAGLADEEAGGRETILLVEDNGPVRTMIQKILETAGYRVLAAADGAEALALSDRRQGRIDLLITDIVMPEMSGRRLAGELEVRLPRLNTLYMSGYPERAIVHHGVLEDGVPFVQKPFGVEALLRKVRGTLRRSDG